MIPNLYIGTISSNAAETEFEAVFRSGGFSIQQKLRDFPSKAKMDAHS